MDGKSTNIPYNARYTLPNIDPLTVSIKAAQEKKIGETREFFEQLVNDHPTCGRFWRIYIEQELKARNFERVEKLFQRALIKVLNIDLWKCYLNYVRDIKSKMSNYKEKTAQAYDFALDKIGLDVMSYSIWVDYINFLKSVEAVGSFAENQKITAIRKVYQKGIMNPMVNVDQLWKDYCAFENQINPLIAKRMIDDRSRESTVVRKVSKEYENVTRHLDRNAPCQQPQGSSDEMRQKQMWRKYIEWEKTNPLKSEDPALVAKRVMYAYDQCLLPMCYHPDIYYEAAAYLQQMSSLMAEKSDTAMSRHYSNECVNLYEKAINSFMKHNQLIYFAYCDFEESRLNYNKVKEIYDKLLAIKEIDPSLCYIQYMRFLRRIEGIRSARAIFKRAREDSRISYHVFIAVAFMEYFCTKDKTIANKIFQLGRKMFGHIPEFIMAYVEMLTHINDDEMIRTLFENVLTDGQLPKEKTSEIWSEWLDYENNAGDLKAIWRAERRREKSLEECHQLEERQTTLRIDRFKFMNLYPCSPIDLKLLCYSELNTAGSSAAPASASSLSFHPENSTKSLDESGAQKQPQLELTYGTNPFTKRLRVKQPRLPEPDISKMVPFKPNRNTLNELQPVPGGGLFLYPAIFADIIKRLPPPTCFSGPYVVIDEFMRHFLTIQLSDDFQSYHQLFMNTGV